MTFSETRSWKEYSRWVPRALGVADRRGDQARSGPIVELAVGDADDPGDLGDAEALLAHDSSVITSVCVAELRRTLPGPVNGRRSAISAP